MNVCQGRLRPTPVRCPAVGSNGWTLEPRQQTHGSIKRSNGFGMQQDPLARGSVQTHPSNGGNEEGWPCWDPVPGDQRFHHQIARGSSPPADSLLACPIKEAFPEWFGQNWQGPAPLGNRRSLAGAQPRSGGTPGAWSWKVKYGHALFHSATARSCEIIRDVIGDAPENAPKRKENRKPANPTPSEKTINIVLCGLLRACDRGVDILMKTRCGCCCRRLCVRCPRGEAV